MSDLDKEISRVKKQKDLIIPADKTTNKYLVPPEKYKTLIELEAERAPSVTWRVLGNNIPPSTL